MNSKRILNHHCAVVLPYFIDSNDLVHLIFQIHHSVQFSVQYEDCHHKPELMLLEVLWSERI